MRTIKISDAVWAEIAARGKFGETEDAVLRRIFELPPEHGAESPQVPSGRRGRGNRRYATKRMSARIEGNELAVKFEDGPAHRWVLPHPFKREEIRRVRDEAVAFARKHGATDPGQTNTVKKALTDAGFHLIGR